MRLLGESDADDAPDRTSDVFADRTTNDATTDDSTDDDAADASGLAARDLVLGYPGTDEPVVDGETVEVPPGEVTALVGPNGSGKSTLLRALADQLDPWNGSVRLDGREIADADPKALARRLGLLSQENDAPATITVEDLVTRGRYPHRGFFESLSADDRRAVDRALSLAGIDDLRDREVGNLSGGQKQLAWVAMALAQETDVLLLDEPTTFLDLHHQLQVMGIVETLRDESDVTVVVVLHDVAQAARYADYLVAMRGGTVYDWGPADDVITEDLLADVFRVDATVSREAGIEIVPHRPLSEDESTGMAVPGGASETGGDGA
jgi:iron complex transport system ATP-binding protein